MNIMHSVTMRQMKLNKRRTIVTIMGVIISVAMITAVTTFAATMMGLSRTKCNDVLRRMVRPL